jgi:hypothetical protein
MSVNYLLAMAVAALVLALASSYLLWFGPAARKPLLHKTREFLSLNAEDEDEDEQKGMVDPHEHLSITNDDAPLENKISAGDSTKGKEGTFQRAKEEKTALKKNS